HLSCRQKVEVDGWLPSPAVLAFGRGAIFSPCPQRSLQQSFGHSARLWPSGFGLDSNSQGPYALRGSVCSRHEGVRLVQSRRAAEKRVPKASCRGRSAALFIATKTDLMHTSLFCEHTVHVFLCAKKEAEAQT